MLRRYALRMTKSAIGDRAQHHMTYEPFSKASVYLEVNRQFVQGVLPHFGGRDCIVDLACGTGMLTELLLSGLRQHTAHQEQESGWSRAADGTKVIGIDISRRSLKLARERFTSLGCLVSPEAMWSLDHRTHLQDPVRMMCVEAPGDRLPVANGVADIVLLGNAVHCFLDKGRLFQEVHRVLRPAGVFAFNSTFYAGGMVAGTEKFYEQWMKEALRYVKRRVEEYKARGMERIVRRRGRGQPAFSNRWLTAAEYGQALDALGFDVVSVTERSIQMSRQHFEGISAYTGTWEAELASVLLSGYPVELACEALESAVGPALESVGVEAVPRAWLEVIGVKR